MSKFFRRFYSFFTRKHTRENEIKTVIDQNFSTSHTKYIIKEDDQLVNDTTHLESFIAVKDYKKQANEDIDIVTRDNLKLINKTYPDYYLMRNLRTKKNGFVPVSHIESLDKREKKISIENKNWYFKDISRRDSERLLEYFENERGVFLIRDSSQEMGRYSLSILDCTKEKQRHAKHYLIERNITGDYYIKKSKSFKTIDELIQYYTSHSDGICCRLLKPCPTETGFNDLKDVWEETSENIQLKEILGKGNFGEVYKGIWRKKFEVAVKTLDIDGLAVKDALDECETLKKLRHEKIIKLWCVCTSQNPIMIVIEYMCNGSLLEYMRKGEGKYLKFTDVIDCAAQIASGMKYMEIINFCHKDLAARNILVGNNKLVKIGDFGLAEKLNQYGKFYMNTENYLFPIKWTAPEIYKVDKNGKRFYTIKSDVWAYGILLFELVTLGDEPYRGFTNQQVMSKIKYENYRMPKPTGMCTEPYYEKMMKCWNSDPQQRDTFESLYNFFNDYFINIEPGYKFSQH